MEVLRVVDEIHYNAFEKKTPRISNLIVCNPLLSQHEEELHVNDFGPDGPFKRALQVRDLGREYLKDGLTTRS